MPNLTPTPAETPVPLIETSTPVLGGVGGPANSQAQALLNQIAYLRGILESTANGFGAALIGIEDSGNNFTATDVEGVLAELSDAIANINPTVIAADVDITDTGTYFTSTNVEGALQEIGAALDAPPVESVNGETGAVVLDAGDIDIVDSGENFTATNVEDALAELVDDINNIPSGAGITQTGEMMAGFIAGPTNKDYKIVVKAAHGGTITETTTICVSGTCTATFKVNTTALGGTANSVSSVEESQAHASSNTFAAGDDIVVTISSNSSCVDMSFTIKYTRTLEA